MVNRLFIPEPLRERVMEMAHTSGHVSYDVTISMLENLAYWPSFRKDLREYISNCLICKEKATLAPHVKLGDTPTPPHPWHTVGMDLLQLPVTKKGHKYLFVLVDILTRYATAIPLADKSAHRISVALKRCVLQDKLLGSPAQIVSDNGLEFANATLKRLFRRYGIRHIFTTPYNPKGNGTTERLNRTLLSLLRGILTPGIEWDMAISSVLDIYNNCPHASIGISPYEAITGRPPRHPQLLPDVQQQLTSTKEVQLNEARLPVTNARLRQRIGDRKTFAETWANAEQQWLTALSHHFGELRESHGLRKHTRHHHANSKRQYRPYLRDDLVVIKDVHSPLGVEGKLRRPYLGPWVVTAVNPNLTLSLADLDGNQLSRAVPEEHVRLWRRPESAATSSTSHGGGEDVTTQ